MEKSAKALGIESNMIAKTLAFKLKEKEILILTKGEAKTDNIKVKDYFKEKSKFFIHYHTTYITCYFLLKMI